MFFVIVCKSRDKFYCISSIQIIVTDFFLSQKEFEIVFSYCFILYLRNLKKRYLIKYMFTLNYVIKLSLCINHKWLRRYHKNVINLISYTYHLNWKNILKYIYCINVVIKTGSSSVAKTVCSKCAEGILSFVTTPQSSSSTKTSSQPKLSIGSIAIT